jgi:hypothetical protein
MMMIVMGGFHAFAGFMGILKDDILVKGPEYTLQLDASTWGWIHLIVGIIVLFAGFGLFSGAVWARTVGVIIGVISALIGFAWLPWYPLWGLMIIFVAITIIWALTTHGRDIAAGEMN